MTCRMSLRRPGRFTDDAPFHAHSPEEEINVGKWVPPMSRIVIIMAAVGAVAFVAAAVGGIFRPAVYLLAGAH